MTHQKPEALREGAIASMKAGRFDQALQKLRQLIASGEDDLGVWYMAGQCCRFLGDLDQAIGYLSEASRRKADKTAEAATFLALGIALQLKERWQEAVNALIRAIEIDPELQMAYNSLALTQKKRGELDKALHNYDAGVKALARGIVKGMRNRLES